MRSVYTARLQLRLLLDAFRDFFLVLLFYMLLFYMLLFYQLQTYRQYSKADLE